LHLIFFRAQFTNTTSNYCNNCTDTSRYMDTNRNSYMDTRYYLDCDNMNTGMDNRFFPDNYNSRKDRTQSHTRCEDNQRACIHYQKPNWEDTRPVLDYPIEPS
jgi:hypothetical protein